LGLAICKDIMERYGGKIEAKNQITGGSLFTISIPLERTSWKTQ
jgi:signal transduction histidine kinase